MDVNHWFLEEAVLAILTAERLMYWGSLAGGEVGGASCGKVRLMKAQTLLLCCAFVVGDVWCVGGLRCLKVVKLSGARLVDRKETMS